MNFYIPQMKNFELVTLGRNLILFVEEEEGGRVSSAVLNSICQNNFNGAIATTTRLEIQRECLTAFDVFSYSMQSSSTSVMSLQCTLKFNNYLHFEKKKKNCDIRFKKHKRKIRTFNKKN